MRKNYSDTLPVYLGHIISEYRLLQLVLQGMKDGAGPPGRGRISWLKNLGGWHRRVRT